MEIKCLVWFFIVSIQAEERLSWFTKDIEVKKSIFVPDNLPEGKEENRVLPWIFHSVNDRKIIELKCIMRGYNASNNPSDYRDARWSHPGFDVSQVNVNAPVEMGNETGIPYAIWSIKVNTSAADAGIKWATCEFQQGDFPLSIDFKFLIFSKMRKKKPARATRRRRRKPEIGTTPKCMNMDRHVYSSGGSLKESDLNNQIEDDIKRQISGHYNIKPSKVRRSAKNKIRFFVWVRVGKTKSNKTKILSHEQKHCKMN